MKLKSERLNSQRGALRTLLSILVHLSIGTIGVVALSALLGVLSFKLASVFGVPATVGQLRWILTGIHGFPVQAVVGLIVGFVLAKYLRRTEMVWIWLLPLMFLCAGILFSARDYSSAWNHFFGYGCGLREHCFDQVGLTLPLIASAGYSLGAALRRAVLGRKSVQAGGTLDPNR